MENSDDQFSLKWNNFQSNLASGFHDLLQEEDMVDVTLAAEGKFLQAHKIILSVCSPYFKDLFKVNPCKHPIVILKDVGHQELADMLDFMYRGEASVRQEDLAAFLKLAETLKVKGLAGDKSADDTTSASQARKPPVVAKKKLKLVETSVFDPAEDDPGDPEFVPGGGGGGISEPKRKRKRMSSPQPKTDNISTSATNNTYVPLANPKQEVQDHEEVEFLDESGNDPLVQFITGKPKHEDDNGDGFDDSNLDADETHDGDLDMTAGPSNADDSTDQVPQGNTSDEKISKFMVQTPIWDFFCKTKTTTGDIRAVCNLCEKSLRFHNTSVMVRHLRYLHPSSYECYRQEYIKGRRDVGYNIRGGILGLPYSPPKSIRKKQHEAGGEVKKMIVLKARVGEGGSQALTQEDLQQLGESITVLNIVKKGTIPVQPNDEQVLEGDEEECLDDEEEHYEVVNLPTDDEDGDILGDHIEGNIFRVVQGQEIVSEDVGSVDDEMKPETVVLDTFIIK